MGWKEEHGIGERGGMEVDISDRNVPINSERAYPRRSVQTFPVGPPIHPTDCKAHTERAEQWRKRRDQRSENSRAKASMCKMRG